MSEFVGQNTGQFVVTLCERDHLARHIDSTTGNAEGIDLWKLDQIETELHLVGRQVLD